MGLSGTWDHVPWTNLTYSPQNFKKKEDGAHSNLYIPRCWLYLLVST